MSGGYFCFFNLYTMNIEIISGSPRKESVTTRVASFLQKTLSANTSHSVGLLDVRDYHFPHLQEVFRTVDKTPEDLKPLAKRMFDADAFILVTPEFNGSYTPALKNLLDHFPKQTRKSFGIVTASTGPMGGMRATQQMQLLINALFGIASPHMLVVPFVDKKFNAEGELIDETFADNVNVFLREFLWLSESLKPEMKTALN